MSRFSPLIPDQGSTFDIEILHERVAPRSPLPSAHEKLAIKEMIGLDRDPVRAAAIFARETGHRHLYLEAGLVKTIITELFETCDKPICDYLFIANEDDGAMKYIDLYWIDGPTIARAKRILDPLSRAGIAIDDGRCKQAVLMPDNQIRQRYNIDGTTAIDDDQSAFPIRVDQDASVICMKRHISRQAATETLDILTTARAEGNLPTDVDFTVTQDGAEFTWRRTDEVRSAMARILAEHGLDTLAE